MELATTQTTQLVRPPNVLAPLIKEDLKQGETAGMPFFIAAGEKLLEAKEQLPGRFTAWVKDTIKISSSTAKKHMEAAEAANKGARGFASLNAFHKATGNKAYMPNKPRPQPWHEPVKEAISKVNVDALKQDALAKQEERALQRKLALSLIDIGFKALATKLHPDKGGSREAMSRLNRVRKILQDAVTS